MACCLSAATQRAWLGIRIVDPASGAVLYQRRRHSSHPPPTPSSSPPLALTRLGPSIAVLPRHRRCARQLRPSGGDLVLEGGGDPTFPPAPCLQEGPHGIRWRDEAANQ